MPPQKLKFSAGCSHSIKLILMIRCKDEACSFQCLQVGVIYVGLMGRLPITCFFVLLFHQDLGFSSLGVWFSLGSARKL